MEAVHIVRSTDGNGIAGFVTAVTARTGSRIHRFLPFSGDEDFDLEKSSDLVIDRSSEIIGGVLGMAHGGVAVVHNGDEDESVLEFRDPSSNVVKGLSKGLGAIADGGVLAPTSKGYWASLEGESHWIAYIAASEAKAKAKAKAGKESKMPKDDKRVYSVRRFSGLALERKPHIISGPGGTDVADVLSVRASQSADDTGDQILATRIRTTGRADSPSTVKVPTEEGVESWTATPSSSGATLAYISGDSIVGTANLHLAGLTFSDSGAKVDWKHSKPLTDVHVSTPLFAKNGKGSLLLMLRWVDKEGVLSIYRASSGGIVSAGDFGVFPEGSTVLDAFYGNEDDELFVIVRKKDNSRWRYELCKVDDLKS